MIGIGTRRARASRRAVATLTAAVATAAMLASCSGPDVRPGSLAETVSLDGASYTVGSKKFVEQLVLCNIAVVALRSVGAQVTPKCGLGGTSTVRTALLSGEIDMYWAYTGTTWVQFFGQEPIPDSEALYRAVKERDRRNGIVWLEPTRFNNTYAFAVEQEQADALGLETLADMAAYVPEHPRPGLVCVESEYLHRKDGLSGLLETYDFRIPTGSLRTFPSASGVYAATDGDSCLFGEVYTTNGRVAALGLEILEDPKNYHIIYNAAIAMRNQAYQQNPNVAEVFEPIANALTQKVMTRLNAQVSVRDKDPKAVATAWLRRKGFIGGSAG